jgi:hypothetical protein
MEISASKLKWSEWKEILLASMWGPKCAGAHVAVMSTEHKYKNVTKQVPKLGLP